MQGKYFHTRYVWNENHLKYTSREITKSIMAYIHNNKIDIPKDYYKNDPWNAPWLPELKPIILEGRYRGMEDIDWCTALRDKGKL